MNCQNCKKPLQLDMYGFGENLLGIEFLGGYSWFIDPLDKPFKAYLCHECAHYLCSTNEWIALFLEPHKSHSHTDNYRRSNPNHFGWDYEYYEENDQNTFVIFELLDADYSTQQEWW